MGNKQLSCTVDGCTATRTVIDGSSLRFELSYGSYVNCSVIVYSDEREQLTYAKYDTYAGRFQNWVIDDKNKKIMAKDLSEKDWMILVRPIVKQIMVQVIIDELKKYVPNHDVSDKVMKQIIRNNLSQFLCDVSMETWEEMQLVYRQNVNS